MHTYLFCYCINIDVEIVPIHNVYISLLQDGSTPLSTAAEKGRADIVELLLLYGADIDKKIDVSSAFVCMLCTIYGSKILEGTNPLS